MTVTAPITPATYTSLYAYISGAGAVATSALVSALAADRDAAQRRSEAKPGSPCRTAAWSAAFYLWDAAREAAYDAYGLTLTA